MLDMGSHLFEDEETQVGVLLSYVAEIRDFEVDHCKVVSEM